jgi:hypothetical protein
MYEDAGCITLVQNTVRFLSLVNIAMNFIFVKDWIFFGQLYDYQLFKKDCATLGFLFI